jgi:beta-glucanase (GH16 family)
VLSITAGRSTNAAGLPFTSGVIATEKSFAQLYGYFQITAELPSGNAMWPSFWLMPASLTGTQEIDPMESFGSVANQYGVTIHAPSSGIDATGISGGNLSKHFNTYGVYWTPTTISFWFDGRMVAVAPTPADMNVPMFMLADLAVSSAATDGTTGGTLKISNISAYAYNPAVPGPAAPLQVAVPATASGAESSTIALPGIAIADAKASARTIAVTVSDKALGILSVAPTSGVTVTANNSWEISFAVRLTPSTRRWRP